MITKIHSSKVIKITNDKNNSLHTLKSKLYKCDEFVLY